MDLNEAELARFQEAFFGKHADGKLRLEDIQALAAAVDDSISPADCQDIFRKLGSRDRWDFSRVLEMLAAKLPAPDSEADLQTAFKVFDTDKNGVITSDELRSVLRNLGERLSPQEIDSLVAELDKDGDGKIDYKEFASAMTGA